MIGKPVPSRPALARHPRSTIPRAGARFTHDSIRGPRHSTCHSIIDPAIAIRFVHTVRHDTGTGRDAGTGICGTRSSAMRRWGGWLGTPSRSDAKIQQRGMSCSGFRAD
ncbi:hypothetical protein B0H13DRAFT_2305882 [Mycena leptocephala]|nr:hypothetical protein B0H13DRAFT_2305882 [Mycena leptocephala]